MEPTYRGLRAVATIFKFLAWISLLVAIVALVLLVASILGANWMASSPATPSPFMPFSLPTPLQLLTLVLPLLLGGGILGGVVHFLFFYAIGDLIVLLINIEENTRTTSILLRRP